MFYFHLQSHERYFQAGILRIASFIQWSNCVHLKLILLGFLSGGSSCVITRLVQKQLLKMRVLHPVHRRWSIIVVFFGIFICIMIMSGRFFVFSPDLGAISAYCCPATLDEFIIFFITLPPIAIHETTREQVPLYCL